ncbi:hypothetical protein GEMRC1_008384 [Eukaryota sp. GEM-RC1]
MVQNPIGSAYVTYFVANHATTTNSSPLNPSSPPLSILLKSHSCTTSHPSLHNSCIMASYNTLVAIYLSPNRSTSTVHLLATLLSTSASSTSISNFFHHLSLYPEHTLPLVLDLSLSSHQYTYQPFFYSELTSFVLSFASTSSLSMFLSSISHFSTLPCLFKLSDSLVASNLTTVLSLRKQLRSFSAPWKEVSLFLYNSFVKKIVLLLVPEFHGIEEYVYSFGFIFGFDQSLLEKGSSDQINSPDFELVSVGLYSFFIWFFSIKNFNITKFSKVLDSVSLSASQVICAVLACFLGLIQEFDLNSYVSVPVLELISQFSLSKSNGLISLLYLPCRFFTNVPLFPTANVVQSVMHFLTPAPVKPRSINVVSFVKLILSSLNFTPKLSFLILNPSGLLHSSCHYVFLNCLQALDLTVSRVSHHSELSQLVSTDFLRILFDLGLKVGLESCSDVLTSIVTNFLKSSFADQFIEIFVEFGQFSALFSHLVNTCSEELLLKFSVSQVLVPQLYLHVFNLCSSSAEIPSVFNSVLLTDQFVNYCLTNSKTVTNTNFLIFIGKLLSNMQQNSRFMDLYLSLLESLIIGTEFNQHNGDLFATLLIELSKNESFMTKIKSLIVLICKRHPAVVMTISSKLSDPDHPFREVILNLQNSIPIYVRSNNLKRKTKNSH